jgi:hypothetical protein
MLIHKQMNVNINRLFFIGSGSYSLSIKNCAKVNNFS